MGIFMITSIHDLWNFPHRLLICTTELNPLPSTLGLETIKRKELNASYLSSDSSWSLKLLNIWTIMSDITKGLAFLHEHRQIHRDLKPRNGCVISFPLLMRSHVLR